MKALDHAQIWPSFRAPLRAFVCRRVPADVDVDDVLQEVSLRVHQALPGLRAHERLDAWLFQITRNAIADALRARQRRGRLDDALLQEAAGGHDDDDVPAAVTSQLARCLGALVDRLAAPYREALTLTELQGLGQREAAAQVGVSLSGMKARVQRGRVKLRALLEDCCAVELDVRNAVVAVAPCQRACGCG